MAFVVLVLEMGPDGEDVNGRIFEALLHISYKKDWTAAFAGEVWLGLYPNDIVMLVEVEDRH